MAINSKQKGKRGELDLCRTMRREWGCEARRGRQYAGHPEAPDVVTDIGGLHIECKFVEKFSLYPAVEQALADCGFGVPVVCHRRSHQEWLSIVPLRYTLEFAECLMRYKGAIRPLPERKGLV